MHVAGDGAPAFPLRPRDLGRTQRADGPEQPGARLVVGEIGPGLCCGPSIASRSTATSWPVMLEVARSGMVGSSSMVGGRKSMKSVRVARDDEGAQVLLAVASGVGSAWSERDVVGETEKLRWVLSRESSLARRAARRVGREGGRAGGPLR